MRETILNGKQIPLKGGERRYAVHATYCIMTGLRYEGSRNKKFDGRMDKEGTENSMPPTVVGFLSESHNA